MRNLPIIDRRNHGIDRSGCQNRSVESSGNRQIASSVDRPSGPRNYQLIVNQFHVIINPAALNPSRIYQSRAPIHQFASESSTLRNPIRNRAVKIAGENIHKYQQPTRPVSATAGLYKLARRQPRVPTPESSDNHPTKRRTHPTDSANLPIIYREILRIYRSGRFTAGFAFAGTTCKSSTIR